MLRKPDIDQNAFILCCAHGNSFIQDAGKFFFKYGPLSPDATHGCTQISANMFLSI